MPTTAGVICAIMVSLFFQDSPNFSGKWSLSVPGRNGARSNSTLTIYQAGPKLSGSLAPDRAAASMGAGASSEIYGAKVEGNTITFYVWRGSDKPAKQFYKGNMHDEEIDFTVTGGPASKFPPPNGQPAASSIQITARRAAE